ncbi:hypothetical protein, partial [Pseudomonas sp. 2995-3]|uniref:hypothetical protein n=1 Tax=Pseudomonas sp. 2995-3 TaxID=1712680 RepID=UPI001C496CCD
MNVSQFVKQHREDWKQLENYTQLLHKKSNNLTGEDMEYFQKLYLKAARHLSYSQTHFQADDVTAYL